MPAPTASASLEGQQRGKTLSADDDNVEGGRLRVRSKASTGELPLPEGSKEVEVGHC